MAALTTTFDYAALDPEARIVVKQKTTEIRGLVKKSAANIIEIGNRLNEVKAALAHGQFGRWLEIEFEWSWKSANRMMRVARMFKLDTVSNLLSARALYQLTMAPQDDDDDEDDEDDEDEPLASLPPQQQAARIQAAQTQAKARAAPLAKPDELTRQRARVHKHTEKALNAARSAAKAGGEEDAVIVDLLEEALRRVTLLEAGS